MDFRFDIWNGQWLHFLSLLLATMGLIYLAVDFLDERFFFLKILTQGLSFGLLTAIFFLIQFFLISLLDTPNILLRHILNIQNPTYVTVTFVQAQNILPEGIIDGFVISVLFSIIREYGKRFSRKALTTLLTTGCFVLICFSLGISILISLFQLNQNYLYLIAEIFADIGGFSLGLIVAQKRVSSRKNFVVWLSVG